MDSPPFRGPALLLDVVCVFTMVFICCFFPCAHHMLTYQRTLRAFGVDAPLFVTSSRDSQRHLTRLSVNISWGSNTKLCQIRRDRRSYGNNALTFKSLSRPYNALSASACECVIIPILNGVFFVII